MATLWDSAVKIRMTLLSIPESALLVKDTMLGLGNDEYGPSRVSSIENPVPTVQEDEEILLDEWYGHYFRGLDSIMTHRGKSTTVTRLWLSCVTCLSFIMI